MLPHLCVRDVNKRHSHQHLIGLPFIYLFSRWSKKAFLVQNSCRALSNLTSRRRPGTCLCSVTGGSSIMFSTRRDTRWLSLPSLFQESGYVQKIYILRLLGFMFCICLEDDIRLQIELKQLLCNMYIDQNTIFFLLIFYSY